MMSDPGFLRWQHSFDRYKSALALLVETVQLAKTRDLSELEKGGLIKRFENAWEMGWKAMADYLKEKEDPDIARTPGSAVRMARAVGLVEDGDAWLNAGKLRNILTHEYSLDQRDEGLGLIMNRFLPLMEALRWRLEDRNAD